MAKYLTGWESPKREALYKAQLMVKLHLAYPRFVFFRHEDRARSGIPDLEVLGNGICSYWEAKHATPKFELPGIQKLTMSRIQRAGIHTRYIIWEEHHDVCKTLIVQPQLIHEWKTAPNYRLGIDHDWLVYLIGEVHS